MSLPRTFKYYRPSGSFSLGVLLWTAIAAAGAVVLAGIYDLVQLIPLVYVSLLAAFGFAIALGKFEEFIVRWGHLRSRSMALMAGMVVAGVGMP